MQDIQNNLDFKTITEPAECSACGKPYVRTVHLLSGRRVFVGRRCPACDARWQEERLAEERASKAQEHEAEWAELCPWEHRLLTETRGHTDLTLLEAAQPDWRKVLDWEYGPLGLLLRGETGTCKTRSVWRLARKLFDQDIRVTALTAGQFDRQCRKAAGQFELPGWFDELVRARVLFFDDLGKGAWTPHTEANFFDLVDQRTCEGRPLLVTTNDSGRSLAERFSPDRAEPLIRRLREYCRCLTFEKRAA